MKLKPYQQRVVDEKKELDRRCAKLVAFINDSDKFAKVNDDERDRLERQSTAMLEYSKILGERIAAFTKKEEV